MPPKKKQKVSSVAHYIQLLTDKLPCQAFTHVLPIFVQEQHPHAPAHTPLSTPSSTPRYKRKLGAISENVELSSNPSAPPISHILSYNMYHCFPTDPSSLKIQCPFCKHVMNTVAHYICYPHSRLRYVPVCEECVNAM